MKFIWMAAICGMLAVPVSAQDAEKEAKPYRTILLGLINEARFERGYPPMEIHTAAQAMAQRWAEGLAKQAKLEHRNRTMLKEALTKNNWLDLSENLHRSADGNQPRVCFDSWMSSSVHRGNLLRATATAAGIGMARGKDGQYYVVFNGITKR
jgi:uncharacterized protein YkwD